MLDNSVIRLEVRSGSVSVIPAQKYQVYDSVTVVDAAGRLGEQPYVAVRQGNDLVLLYADGTEVVLQDYFLGDTLFSMDGLGGVIELPADMAPIGMIDGKALYTSGTSPCRRVHWRGLDRRWRESWSCPGWSWRWGRGFGSYGRWKWRRCLALLRSPFRRRVQFEHRDLRFIRGWARYPRQWIGCGYLRFKWQAH